MKRNLNLAKLDRVKMLSYENQAVPIGFDDDFWNLVREEYLADFRLTINILDELRNLYIQLNARTNIQKLHYLSRQEEEAYLLVKELITYLEENPKKWNNDYIYDRLKEIETV